MALLVAGHGNSRGCAARLVALDAVWVKHGWEKLVPNVWEKDGQLAIVRFGPIKDDDEKAGRGARLINWLRRNRQ